MSQRLKSGFNAPRVPVGAGDKPAVVPRSLLPPFRCASLAAPSGVRTFFDPSVWRGVAQPVRSSLVFRRLHESPAAL